MKKPYTVQCAHAAYYGNIVTVEADTLDETLDKAIQEADGDPDGWRSMDDAGPTFVVEAREGTHLDPLDRKTPALPIPDRFTEQGEPPVVTLIDPGQPGGGAIEVSRGRILLCFTTRNGTVTGEVSDPPHPPANHPLVVIRRRADGAPDVTVTEGRARVRILYP